MIGYCRKRPGSGQQPIRKRLGAEHAYLLTSTHQSAHHAAYMVYISMCGVISLLHSEGASDMMLLPLVEANHSTGLYM